MPKKTSAIFTWTLQLYMAFVCIPSAIGMSSAPWWCGISNAQILNISLQQNIIPSLNHLIGEKVVTGLRIKNYQSAEGNHFWLGRPERENVILHKIASQFYGLELELIHEKPLPYTIKRSIDTYISSVLPYNSNLNISYVDYSTANNKPSNHMVKSRTAHLSINEIKKQSLLAITGNLLHSLFIIVILAIIIGILGRLPYLLLQIVDLRRNWLLFKIKKTKKTLSQICDQQVMENITFVLKTNPKTRHMILRSCLASTNPNLLVLLPLIPKVYVSPVDNINESQFYGLLAKKINSKFLLNCSAGEINANYVTWFKTLKRIKH